MVKLRNFLYLGMALLPLFASCSKGNSSESSDTSKAAVATDSVAQVEADSLATAEKMDSIAIGLSKKLVTNNARLAQFADENAKAMDKEIANLKVKYNNLENSDSVEYKKELAEIESNYSKTMKDSVDALLVSPVWAVISAENRASASQSEGEGATPKSWLDFWKELSIWNTIIIVAIFILGALLGFIIALLMRRKPKNANKTPKKPVFKKIAGKDLDMKGDEKDFYKSITESKN